MGVNRHPFVKDKWDERAYFLVQDVLYEGMDDGHVSVNAGKSRARQDRHRADISGRWSYRGLAGM
jgi:hypothetical protein